MIALRVDSLDRALAALSARRVLVVRASRIELTLPAGATETNEPSIADTVVMSFDAVSVAEAAARVASFPAHRTIACALPIARAGVVSWALARARRLQPVELEDACDALRHAGVIDVRVTSLPGSLPIAVVTGRTTAPFPA